ncbi:MAG: YihY/virulence factor BrkB family protein [Acidobacteriota bacterium]
MTHEPGAQQHEAFEADYIPMPSIWKLGGLSWKELLRRTWRKFWTDRVLDQSAMLSFYFLLAIFPLFLFLIALVGLLLQSGPVLQERLHEYLAAVVPGPASTLIDATLGEIDRGSGALKLSIALLFTWWSASQGMFAIVSGLNIAYEVGESRPWWKKYLVASGLTIVSLVLFACALLLLIYGGRFSASIANHFGYSGFIAGMWRILTWLLLLAVVLMAFNILYRYAPNVKRRQWHWLMPGTVAGITLWLLGSFGFQLYLSFFNSFTVTYGSIGAVIILLLWLYLSGIAILVGGEVNSVIEKESGQVPKLASE